MKLSDWRDVKGWTQQHLADEIGCTVSAVWRYEQGLRDPEAATKEKIFLITEGAVQPNDFYPIAGWRRALAAILAAALRKAA